jgi:hypothetical protein
MSIQNLLLVLAGGISIDFLHLLDQFILDKKREGLSGLPQF